MVHSPKSSDFIPILYIDVGEKVNSNALYIYIIQMVALMGTVTESLCGVLATTSTSTTTAILTRWGVVSKHCA